MNFVDGHGSQVTQNDQMDHLIALDYDILCVKIVGRTSADAQGIAEALLALSVALSNGEAPSQAVSLENKHYIWLPYQPVIGILT